MQRAEGEEDAGPQPGRYTRDNVREVAYRTFPDEYPSVVLEILDLYETPSAARRARMQLAVLKLSNGSVDLLLSYLERAQRDPGAILREAHGPQVDDPRFLPIVGAHHCGYGVVGFWRPDGQAGLVVRCDECGAGYRHPSEIASAERLAGLPSGGRWAGWEDIEEAGWAAYIGDEALLY